MGTLFWIAILALGIGIACAIIFGLTSKKPIGYQDYEKEERFEDFMGLGPGLWVLFAFIFLAVGLLLSVLSYNTKNVISIVIAVCALGASGFSFYGMYESNKYVPKMR
jgi:uncharacterized membrane protein YhaH (DUF805 family)